MCRNNAGHSFLSKIHTVDKDGQLVSFTSGAGPVKAMTSCIVSLSSVNLMVPMPPAVTVGGVALLPSSSAEHLSSAALCGAAERFVCSLVLQEKAGKRCCDICVTKDAQGHMLDDCKIRGAGSLLPTTDLCHTTSRSLQRAYLVLHTKTLHQRLFVKGRNRSKRRRM